MRMSAPDPMSDLLQSWRHQPASAPEFQLGVWAKIEAARGSRSSHGGLFRWALPLAASLAIAAGVGSALRESRQQHRERMAAAYVQSIDPFQMHGHQP